MAGLCWCICKRLWMTGSNMNLCRCMVVLNCGLSFAASCYMQTLQTDSTFTPTYWRIIFKIEQVMNLQYGIINNNMEGISVCKSSICAFNPIGYLLSSKPAVLASFFLFSFLASVQCGTKWHIVSFMYIWYFWVANEKYKVAFSVLMSSLICKYLE